MSEDEKSRIDDVPPGLKLPMFAFENYGIDAMMWLLKNRATDSGSVATRHAFQLRQMPRGYNTSEKSVTKLVKQICDVTSLKGSYEFGYTPDKRIENKMVLGFLRITDERANQLPAFTVYASDD